MRRFFIALSVAVLGAINPYLASAQDFGTLLRDFDSKSLSNSEKRFIQAALAFEGEYNGLLDGDWGRLSQRALQTYSRRQFGTDYEEWHLAFLAMSFLEKYETDGWAMRYLPFLDMSLLWPEKTIIEDPATEHFANYRHYGSSLAISFGRHTKTQTQNLHDFTIQSHAASSSPYTVRKTNFAVSSVTKRDGSKLYTRSNFINGAWSTIMLSASQRDSSLLNALTTSIAVGRAPSLAIEEGGRLEQAIIKTAALLETTREQENALPTTPEIAHSAPTNTAPSESTGTGFFVSNEGHVLTNAHVVENCVKILVDGKPAKLVSTSEQFDLAVLEATFSDTKAVAVFSASPARLNSDVTAVGYPYAGVLGGLNVTRGSVSSLNGIAGDAFTMQVTAPVQSGNSGGPSVDTDGEVGGVVVFKPAPIS